MSWMKIVGRNIRYARTQMGYTQAKLAELADLSDGYINKLERGVSNLTIPNLFTFSKILNTPVEQLLKGAAPDCFPPDVPHSTARDHIYQRIASVLDECDDEYAAFICKLMETIITEDRSRVSKRKHK